MKTKYYLLTLIISLYFFAGCNRNKPGTNNEERIAVKTAKVEYKDFSLPIISSGMIASKKEAKLSFKTGGIIKKLYVNIGDAIRKGQLLATLDMTEINAQVKQAKNLCDKAKRDYDRVQKLFNENAATYEQLQNAQTGYETSEQSVKIAQFNQQYSAIYATESGRVIQKFLNEGELVNPGVPVYMINSSDKDDWVIRIGVSDKDWARISKGDKAVLTFDAYPGEKFAASVSEIAEAADPYSGTFQIELKINPGARKLADGLSAKVELTPYKSEKLYIIPIEALTESNQNEGSIYIANPDNSVKKQKVRIAQILSDKVAVKSGIENVPEVITEGLAYLSPDSKIKIIKN
jgi:membrane fusion protein, multidrug efflux system